MSQERTNKRITKAIFVVGVVALTFSVALYRSPTILVFAILIVLAAAVSRAYDRTWVLAHKYFDKDLSSLILYVGGSLILLVALAYLFGIFVEVWFHVRLSP